MKEPNAKRTTFQTHFDTDLDYYTWLKTRPLEKESFHHFMEEQMANLPHWLDAVDFPKEFGAGLGSNDVAFVDVGGSIGQQCEALKKRYPDLQGRVILQDKPDVVENALPVPGMESMDYNYLEEQPVKSEWLRFYRRGQMLICFQHRRSCILLPSDHAQQRRRHLRQDPPRHTPRHGREERHRYRRQGPTG